MLGLITNCCGLDVHKDIIQACILRGEPQEESPEVILSEFGTGKDELLRLAKFLVQHKCYHVAMESTGVYWRPIYQLFEEERCMEEVYVVNAHHMRNLSGRKSDVKDAEWIATLYRHGLLRSSFIPERKIRELREISRLRRALTNEHTLNLIDIENARVGRLKATPKELETAMRGELDALERKLLQTLLNKLDSIDREIAELTALMKEVCAEHQEQIAQLDSIPGIDINAALEIIAEISPEPQRYFANSKKLCSWAGLVPRNDESAGKIKCSKIMPGNPRIKALLCQTAWVAVYARNSTFHSWFWKHQARIGRKKAIIAVARKMLSLIFKLLASGGFYDPMVASCA